MSSEVRIRPVTPSERDSWVRLRAELWPSHSIGDLAREADEHLGGGDLWKFGNDSIPFLVLVAERPAGEVVGFVEASLRPWADKCRTAPVGYLEGWYVVPELRRQGIGGALVRAAEEWARSRGCREMASDAHLDNVASDRSHRALGYEEVERLIHYRRSLSERETPSNRSALPDPELPPSGWPRRTHDSRDGGKRLPAGGRTRPTAAGPTQRPGGHETVPELVRRPKEAADEGPYRTPGRAVVFRAGEPKRESRSEGASPGGSGVPLDREPPPGRGPLGRQGRWDRKAADLPPRPVPRELPRTGAK